MGYPVAIVQIAFDDGPTVANPTWTDVSSYVRELSTYRGRNDDQSQFEAGTASIVLDNRARTFDPFYTSGPYYGKLTPRRQVQIIADSTAIGGGLDYVFRGHIEGWPVSITNQGYDSTVTISCTDPLAFLATVEMPDNISGQQILSWGPRHYYPLDDPVNPTNPQGTTWRDLGAVPMPFTTTNDNANRVANLDGLAPGLPDTCLSISSSSTAVLDASAPIATTFGLGVSYMAWFVLSDPDNSSVICQFGAGGIIVEASYVAGSTFDVNIYNGSTVYQYHSTGTYFDTTTPHHIGISISAGPVPVAYIDGQPVTWTSNTSAAFSIPIDEFVDLTNGQHQQVAVFTNAALAGVYYSTIYNMGRNVIAETTPNRVARIMAAAGWTRYYVTPGATQSFYEISAGGPQVLAELQLASDTEGGNLYATKNGTVYVTGRRDIFAGSSLNSQATFGGAGISIEGAVRYQVSADNMRNQATVVYSGQGAVEIQDATSVTAYGPAGGTISTQLADTTAATDLGNQVVGFGKDPTAVLDPFGANVHATDADWPTVLGLELLERITVNVVPRVGSAVTFAQHVQAIEHTVTQGQWSTRITGSTRYTNPFVLGSSLLGGTDYLT